MRQATPATVDSWSLSSQVTNSIDNSILLDLHTQESAQKVVGFFYKSRVAITCFWRNPKDLCAGHATLDSVFVSLKFRKQRTGPAGVP